MKTAARVYRWVIISVVLQIIFLAFINFIFLAGKNRVTSTSVDVPAPDVKPKKNVDMKVPTEATGFKVSFNGSYAGYIQDKQLVIIDLLNKKIKKTINTTRENLTYYRWLPDRNMVIYSVCAQENEPGKVQIFTYEVDSDVLRDYPKISNIPKGSKVEDIELSPQTNIIYTKVNTGKSNAVIYKFNIMNNLSYIMNTGTGTVIKETSYSDKLVYQNEKNKLFSRDGIKNVTWQFPFKNKMALLEIDSEDKVYVGELNKDNKVAKIYFGKLAVEPGKSWTTVALKNPVAPEKLFVTPNGSIYESVESENCVYDVRTGGKIEYSGRFVEILDDYVVTLDNNEIKLNVIKEAGEKLKK